jgi:DNA polymerase elongation subunit (family B)
MNQLIYGANQEEKIVAVHPASERTVKMFIRNPEGIISNEIEFFPFFFLSNQKYLSDYPKKHWIKELTGENYYRYLCVFNGWLDMWDAIRHCLERYNENAPQKIDSYTEMPVLRVRTDPVAQFLKQSGRTLFKGMKFDDLHRIQLSIKTYVKHGFKISNPNREEDRIVAIALSDNHGWEYQITGKRKSEKEMLLDLIKVLQEKDADVIEGHNSIDKHIHYLMTRCEIHGLEFNIGRDGSIPHHSEARSLYGERTANYIPYEIVGRHVIDTATLLQSYDSTKHELDNYNLEHAAQHFGISKVDRLYISPDRVSWYSDNEPDNLVQSSIDDVREIRLLSDYLSPDYFHQTQMLPFNYATVTRLNSNNKIESLLLREYIRQKHSIPRPEIGSQPQIGGSEIFYRGLLGPIIDLDIESIYPSIILAHNIVPKNDTLGAFPKILNGLTDHLSDLKRQVKIADNSYSNVTSEATEIGLKVLINSFYAYIGNSRALFNDYKAARTIGEARQDMLRQLMSAITSLNGKVIEIDSNSICFVPPVAVNTETKEKELLKNIARCLPSGITLQMNDRYKRMLSYKKNNYVLLGYDGKVTIKGSSLIPRNIERFGREFITQCISAIMNLNFTSVHDYYIDCNKAIVERKLSIQDFARIEILRDTYDEYTQSVNRGDRYRSASYEVAINSGMNWKQGDKISYYITGDDTSIKGFDQYKAAIDWDKNFRDENVGYYLKRLEELAKRFASLFSEKDYHALFSVDDLFGFSPEGIQIQTTQIKEEPKDLDEETEQIQVEPRIWLDEEI